MKNRPILIAILGVLSIISGLLGTLFIFTEKYSLYKLFLGNTIFILIAGVAFFKILIGVGFIKGWTWTWFGGIFICAYKMGKNIILLMSIFTMNHMPLSNNLGLIFKTLVGQLITLLFVSYLMGHSAVDYFELDELEKGKYLTLTSIASLLLLASVYVFFKTQGGALIHLIL